MNMTDFAAVKNAAKKAGVPVRDSFPAMIRIGDVTLIAVSRNELETDGLFLRGAGGFVNDAQQAISLIAGASQ